jgi:GMP synthase (glutamine-hydrolysing)
MNKKTVLIMKTGETLGPLRAGGEDFEDWMRAGLGLDAHAAPAVSVHLGQPLPEASTLAGVVITGSPAMLTDGAHWNVVAAHWLRDVVERGLPVLGICYGHQLLAHACGGQVDYHPAGREIGTVPVTLTAAAREDVLLAALPECFHAHTSHSQAVLTLPDGAVLLAASAHDAHHAFRIGERAWGVQFHPEFTARVMRTYVQVRQEALRAEGFDVDALLRDVVETPAASAVLRRFAALCGG